MHAKPYFKLWIATVLKLIQVGDETSKTSINTYKRHVLDIMLAILYRLNILTWHKLVLLHKHDSKVPSISSTKMEELAWVVDQGKSDSPPTMLISMCSNGEDVPKYWYTHSSYLLAFPCISWNRALIVYEHMVQCYIPPSQMFPSHD